MWVNCQCKALNPISAGVLENKDMLGGGQFDPPPLNPMFDVQILQMIHHWEALLHSFRICKKIANLQKLNFLLQNPII